MTSRPRVLIVEDNVDDVAMYTRYLLRSQQARFVVYTAASVAAGLQSAVELAPDCIVVDLELGDADGLEFLAELHARNIFIPTIAVTAAGDEHLPIAYMRLGARDFLRKGDLTQETLVGAVLRIVESSELRRSVELSRAREAETAGRLEAALTRASFLSNVSKRFAASLDFEETLELAASLALPMLGDVCIVDLFDANVLYRRAVVLEDGRYPTSVRDDLSRVAPSSDAAEGVPAVVRAQRAAYYDGPALAAVTRDDADLADLRRSGLSSVAIVPLIANGRCFGALTLGIASPSHYRDETRKLTEEFVQRAATSLANARALEGMRIARDQAESARRRLTFQSRVSSLLARSLEWQPTFARLAKIFVASLCDAAEIHLLDRERDEFRRVAAASADADTAALMTRLRRRFPPRLDDRHGIGRCAAQARPVMYGAEIGDVVQEYEGEHARLLREWSPGGAIFAPIVLRGEVAGVISVYRDRQHGAFSIDDLALVEDTARRAATYYETARLYEREHSIASTLQNSLLPNRIPDPPGIRFASRYLAGADGMDVGGDWYDVIETDDGRFVITLGDVVGRGMLAAAAMGQMRDILRAYAFEDFAPANALARLNALLDRTGGEHFATVVYLVYDPAARTLTYANAGHPPPLVAGPDRTVTALDAVSGTPIGAWADAQYGEATLAFEPGSTLLLYTDGLVETRERGVMEGIEELAAAVHAGPGDPEDLVDAVIASVAPNHSDDTALLAVRSVPEYERGRRVWTRAALDARAATLLRAEVAAHLRPLVSAEQLADALLVVGELLGNVVRHAPGPVRVLADADAAGVAIEVEDRGPGLSDPTPDLADDLECTSGRGLSIVRSLARDVAVLPRPDGGTSVRVLLAETSLAETA